VVTGNNSTEIGFEKEICDVACVLRGNIDTSEYKHVVLGLIFLKYLSDKFEERYNALKDEGEGFEEDRDAYAEKRVFYVPVKAHWGNIAARVHSSEIGKTIDEAMGKIERENEELKGVPPKTLPA
jgi:type I restriction enzyme M protein